jgi:hypothetical protein
MGSPDGISGAGSTTLGSFVESYSALGTSSSTLMAAGAGDSAYGGGRSTRAAMATVITNATATVLGQPQHRQACPCLEQRISYIRQKQCSE